MPMVVYASFDNEYSFGHISDFVVATFPPGKGNSEKKVQRNRYIIFLCLISLAIVFVCAQLVFFKLFFQFLTSHNQTTTDDELLL
jgi:hypothetical protein